MYPKSTLFPVNVSQKTSQLYWYRPVAYPICRSVCLSVWKVYCGKTVEWIWMPFVVVSGVGRGMGVLDGMVIVEGKGQFWG